MLSRAFDKIAKRRDVFKVETIGDCYVAVAGLPHARNDHAVAMALFARDCMIKMTGLVHLMEEKLGPDTGKRFVCSEWPNSVDVPNNSWVLFPGELSMRFGLHSGPVTAGVLRGEKSRFQLFGDAVNTAARIETTGERGRIHISHETAELLITAGHSKWVVPRRDLVTAKGKGVMRTYWLVVPEEGAKSTTGSLTDDDASMDEYKSNYFASNGTVEQMKNAVQANAWGNQALVSTRQNRLIEWNVDVLMQLLQKVIVKRQKEAAAASDASDALLAEKEDIEQKPMLPIPNGLKVPRFGLDSRKNEEKENGTEMKPLDETVPLDPAVGDQLRAYVVLIHSMYRDHPFHNFEHASHVMLSITKLMSRITTPNLDEVDESEEGANRDVESLLHSYTYGIASDPLLMFAVAFSALIHDVDHPGVPNNQLIQEDANLAKKYRYKSVAEKHSIRLAWERLMDSDYRAFRTCLCPNQNELKRFRNFVVNTVMATDIADKELNAKRKERWHECFEEWPEEPTADDVQRKATIVIEHLIQASDVAHTMQHFEVFKKWNERLFYEVYTAFDSGRGANDPSIGWYDGEIGFFDFYVVPLAQKLGTCGVFGVASDEYLNYAQENRQKWKKEGKSLVERWLLEYHSKKREKLEATRKK